MYSRVVVGWRLSNSLSKEACLEALEDEIWRYGKPSIINSDQGTQFTSEEWGKLCSLNEIKISMSHKGGSIDNAYIERFWRTLKFEGFYLIFPKKMGELQPMLSSFIHWYNEERLHSALKCRLSSSIHWSKEEWFHSALKYKTSKDVLKHEEKAQKMPEILICEDVDNSLK